MANDMTTNSDLGYADTLWKAADALRGQVDAAEYKHVVLGLIFADDQPAAAGAPQVTGESFAHAVLQSRLRDAIGHLNPAIPADARNEAIRTMLAGDLSLPGLQGIIRVEAS